MVISENLLFDVDFLLYLGLYK